MSKKYIKLGSILKKLLFEKNMRPIDLAREAKIPATTIHRLINGKSTRPYKTSLEPIADYFAITLEQLTGEEPTNISLFDAKNSIFNNSIIKKVPIIPWQNAVNFSQLRNTSPYEIAVSGNLSIDAFALMMSDSSMEPLFPYGTILIFNYAEKIKDRSYVLVKIHDKEVPIFRQMLIDVEHQFIKPLNPDLCHFGIRLLEKKDKVIACLYESRIIHQFLDDEEIKKELICAEYTNKNI